MGLDMYLKASKYVSGYNHNDAKEKREYANLLQAFGLKKTPCENTPSGSLELTVAYWRKANAIHAWFVNELADGKDECQSGTLQSVLEQVSESAAFALFRQYPTCLSLH